MAQKYSDFKSEFLAVADLPVAFSESDRQVPAALNLSRSVEGTPLHKRLFSKIALSVDGCGAA